MRLTDVVVTAFINLASWNVSPAPVPIVPEPVRAAQPRGLDGRFIKVAA